MMEVKQRKIPRKSLLRSRRRGFSTTAQPAPKKKDEFPHLLDHHLCWTVLQELQSLHAGIRLSGSMERLGKDFRGKKWSRVVAIPRSQYTHNSISPPQSLIGGGMESSRRNQAACWATSIDIHPDSGWCPPCGKRRKLTLFRLAGIPCAGSSSRSISARGITGSSSA